MDSWNPQQLKVQLERRLGSPIDQLTFNLLENRYRDSPFETRFEDMLGDIRAAMPDQPGPAQRQDVPMQRSDDPRWPALARILALEAAGEPDVQRWRAKYLRQGEPVPVDWLGATVSELALCDREMPIRNEATIAIGNRDEVGELVEGRPLQIRTRTLTYRSDGHVQSRLISPDGPLADLGEIGARLAGAYHWNDADAVTFVLTDLPPPVPGLTLSIAVTERPATSRVYLEFDPRVPDRRIKEAVKTAREAAAALRPDSDFAKPLRPIEERTAELAIFAASRRHMSWRDIRIEWNAKNPEWRYGEERTFSSAVDKAWQRVVGDKFRHAR